MKIKNLLFAVIIALFFTGCNQESYEPDYTVPPFIIDSHMHYSATDEWEKSFIEIYTDYNAMACLMIDIQDIDRGIAFAKANPERVIPYAAVDIESPTLLQDVQMVYDRGFKGLGELFATGDYDYNDPKYEPFWALAERLRLAVAPHTGNLSTGIMDHLRPGSLADVAARHPGLFMHAAHFGNPWYNEAGEATRRNKNLYFDLSGSSLIKKENDPGFWAQWLWWTDAIGKPHMPEDALPAWEKILFATDEGPDALKENIRRFNKVLNACNVSDETRAKCYGLTVAEFHGIQTKVIK